MKKRILHCAYSGLGGHAAVLFTILEPQVREGVLSSHPLIRSGRLVQRLRSDMPTYRHSFVFVKKRGLLSLPAYLRVLRTICRVRPDLIMINGVITSLNF